MHDLNHLQLSVLHVGISDMRRLWSMLLCNEAAIYKYVAAAPWACIPEMKTSRIACLHGELSHA